MASHIDQQPPIIELVAADPNLEGVSSHPEIKRLAAQPDGACDGTGVIIDVSGLDLITSRGLAQLVMIRRGLDNASGRVVLAGACDQIARILKVCHLDNFFPCAPSVEQARGLLEA